MIRYHHCRGRWATVRSSLLSVANARDSTRDPTSPTTKNSEIEENDLESETSTALGTEEGLLTPKPTTKPCLMNKRIVQCGHIVFSEIANEIGKKVESHCIKI